MAERRTTKRPTGKSPRNSSTRSPAARNAAARNKARSGAGGRSAPPRGEAKQGAANSRSQRANTPAEIVSAAVPSAATGSAGAGDYLLIDSGNQRKLERVGPYLLVRPSPQALWSPRLSPEEWNKADGVYHRESEGGGRWEWRDKVKRDFDVLYAGLSMQLKLTNFGHMGLFAEQAENWDWMRGLIRTRMAATNQRNFNVLNLFGYTGGSTLACSQAGAHVVHLDAAKGVVDWARVNAKLSNLDDRPIRWIVDDALKYLKREERRRARYQGIILDPPSFGRGPQGEVFKIEDDIIPLLEACRDVLAGDALFVLYSCHTPGFTPLTMENQLREVLARRGGKVEAGEMTVRETSGRPLPSGTWARWVAAE